MRLSLLSVNDQLPPDSTRSRYMLMVVLRRERIALVGRDFITAGLASINPGLGASAAGPIDGIESSVVAVRQIVAVLIQSHGSISRAQRALGFCVRTLPASVRVVEPVRPSESALDALEATVGEVVFEVPD